MPQLAVTTFTGSTITCSFDKQPNSCPFCHRSITPKRLNASRIADKLGIIYQCPDVTCQEIFIGYYTSENPHSANYTFKLQYTSLGTIQVRSFTEAVKRISHSFIETYNQALKAEELGLNHICGIGYRKAWESLIKDYLMKALPSEKEQIKNKPLRECIEVYVSNPNLKDMASRASWLSNEKVHFTRNWDDKDITYLKILIDVTTHWIEMEILTEKYKAEMQQS